MIPTVLRAIPKIQSGILLALIVGVPVLVAPSVTLDPFNVPKFALLLAGCSIVTGLWCVQIFMGQSPKIVPQDVIVPAAIVVPLLVGWSFSPYRSWALLGQYPRLQGLLPYLLFALFAVEVAVLLRGQGRKIAWAVAGAGALVGLGQLAGVMGYSPTGGLSEASTIGNSNFVGGFLAITFPLALYLWISSGKGWSRTKVVAISATILIGEGLVLSFSEGGQAAALAGGLILVGCRAKSRWIRIGAAASTVAIAMALVGAVAVPLLRPIGGFTATLRSYWWGSAVAVASEAPLVGRGPNAFALEGSRYRPLEDVLAHRRFLPGFTPLEVDHQTSDDPHSVPLSFLVGAGGLGLAGLTTAAVWLTRKAARLRTDQGVGAALFAAMGAYLVQALVSVDEVSLRLGFWTCLGGFLACLPPRTVPDTPHASPRLAAPGRGVAGFFVGGAILVAGLWGAFSFARADQLARSGAVAFAQDNVRVGERDLGAALALRDDPTYRQILAEYLGISALEGEPGGAALIAKMRDINSYLADVPDVGALHAYARLMHYWGEHDPPADRAAIQIYERAARLDPNNPLILIEQAEALVDLGQVDAALDLLEPLTAELDQAMPEFWGALAMIRVQEGDHRGAAEAVEAGTQLDPRDCRVSLARELLSVSTQPERPRIDDVTRLNLALRCDPGLYERFLRLAQQ